MSRTVPQCPVAAAVTTHHPGRCTKQYEITVITPIVGGGVEPYANDPVWVIRPTAVRGHLRFWWRATCGMPCSTPVDLFAREGRIWGTTNGPGGRALASPVEVEVRILNQGSLRNWRDFQNAGYVLFPFRQIPNGQVRQGVKFALTLRYPQALHNDVETAVWAWVNFGGIGARTRRGCGALFCHNGGLHPPNEEAGAWFQAQRNARQILSTPTNPHVPWTCLAQAPLFQRQNPPVDPIEAWMKAVALLRDFRQAVGFARDPGAHGPVPGRSRWPEADSIRAVAGRTHGPHATPTTLPAATIAGQPGFPRADLGLPIVFQFRGEDLRATIEPTGSFTRMASPVILRPFAYGNGTTAMPMLLILYALPASGVDLEWTDDHGDVLGTRQGFPRNTVIDPRLAAYPNSPMKGRTINGWAREALFQFARSRGYT